MKSFDMVVIATCIFVAAIMMLTKFTEALPLDLYDELSDDKLYDGMIDFLDTIASEDDTIPRQARLEAAERCRLPVRKGVCRALIPRWSYDPEIKDCREFKFGGCDGNGNNFLNYKQCMATCVNRKN